jgi:hypothetical protein
MGAWEGPVKPGINSVCASRSEFVDAMEGEVGGLRRIAKVGVMVVSPNGGCMEVGWRTGGHCVRHPG